MTDIETVKIHSLVNYINDEKSKRRLLGFASLDVPTNLSREFLEKVCDFINQESRSNISTAQIFAGNNLHIEWAN
jgi:hypothetical protein